MYQRELKALEAGATVVTANNRLARTLRHAHTLEQQRRGLLVWASPNILAWSAWLQQLWEEARLHGEQLPSLSLLDEAAADLVWRQSITLAESAAELPPVVQFARLARGAWRLLNEWQGLTAEEWTQPDLSPDQVAFLRWSGVYRNRCRDAGWIDAEQLPVQVSADIAAGRVPVPAALVFAGFDAWPPARQQLLEACRAAGAEVAALALIAAVAPPQARICASPEQEISQAASWARQSLEANPAARIGLVVPDLSTRAAEVRRACLDVFAPAWRVDGVPAGLPLNVSYGQPLATTPLVHAALLLLQLVGQRVSFDDFSLLLRSPWLVGSVSEAATRARLELKLRDRLRVEFSLDELLIEVAQRAPQFEKLLARLVAHREQRAVGSAHAWAQWFAELPQCVGWPGEATLDSTTYQTLQAWNSLLANFAASGAVLGTLDYTAACTALRQLALQTVFQPEGIPTGLQVMGVLEAAGHEFDQLWVCGMARELWPSAQRPNVCIPLGLQRRLQMPDASAGHTLDFVRQQTQRLLSSAPQVVVSWPAEVDGEALGPSPLLGLMESPVAVAPEATVGWNAALLGSAPLERLEHDPPPPLAQPDAVRGGAAVLSMQAVSPIDAFMQKRLGAAAIEVPAVGLSPRHKGNLTHVALETLYRQVNSQSALAALTQEEREALLRRGLRRAAARVPGSNEPFMRRLLDYEIAAQLRRLHEFLELDLARPDFVQVQPEALTEAAQIGPLTLRLQLDRLDTLASGGQLVIDYKTGQVDRSNWNPDRPGDLQLPLYVTAVAPAASGVAFAQIAPANIGYDCVGQPDLDIEGMRSPGKINRIQVRYQYPGSDDLIESWDELRLAWRECLERLAREFAAGDFRFDPRNPTSGRGQFAVLSRVYDAGAVLDEEGS
jgi:ATP-dependent helicase/nuclease subunit B